MAKRKKAETEVERTHGHCADVLMDDYGIPKDMREQVCGQIALVWKQNTMIHCLIIASVRGYQPNAATRGLEYFLKRHATHEPKHQKPMAEERQQGHFDSQGNYHHYGR